MKIGKVKLGNQLILAPMAGVNCLPFRLMCKKAGAGLVSTAMVDVQSFLAKPEVFGPFLKEEAPLSIQLVTPDAKMAADAAGKLQKFCQIIDINFGCPAISATKTGRGAALLREEEKLGEIVKSVVDAVKVPVTAKIRLGWRRNNGVELAKVCEKSGASAVAVHGRLFGQGYGYQADWAEIGKIKEALAVPVIGNGDVWNGRDAEELMAVSKCDGVMVARGAIGDPDVFRRMLHYLESGEELPMPSGKEKLETYLELMGLYRKHGLKERLGDIKNQAVWFSKGVRHGAEFRNKVARLGSVEEVEDFVKRTLEGLRN